MSLFAKNKTGAALPMAAGNPTPPILPTSGTPGVEGQAMNVTSELRPDLTVDPVNGVAGGLDAAAFALIEVQRVAGDLDLVWDGEPEYQTATLTIGGEPLSADQKGALDAASPALSTTNPPLTEQDTGVVRATRTSDAHYVRGTSGNDGNGGTGPGDAFQTLAKGVSAVPFQVTEDTLLSAEEVFNDQGVVYIEKDVAKDKKLLIDFGNERVPMSALAGQGDSIAISGVFPTITVTLTDAGANFTSNLVGKKIWLQGCANWFNAYLGPFTITAVPGPTQVQWMALVPYVSAEPAFAGRWFISPFDAQEGSSAGGSFAEAGGTVTATLTNGDFTEADVGKKITFAGALSGGNNGSFVIASVTSPTDITYANSNPGVTEAFAGAWTLGGYVADKDSPQHIGLTTSAWFKDQFRALQVELMTGLTSELRTCHGVDEAESGAAALNGTGDDFYEDAIGGAPDYFDYVAIGNRVTLTDFSADFTKDRLGDDVDLVGKNVVIAGSTGNDGTFAIVAVLNEHQVVYVNPAPGVTEVGAGTWKVAISTTMTLEDAAGDFNQFHVGKTVTIAGSTSGGNDGPFAITKVLSKTAVQYVNPTGVTEAVAGTWTLERSLTAAAGVMTLVDCAADFSSRLVGKEIAFAGSGNPLNDTTKVVTEVVSPIELKFANGVGVTEALYPGTWTTEHGWITPIRDYSAAPTGAEFRFVRPKTKLTGSSELRIKNLGQGEIIVQGLYLEGGNADILAQGCSGSVRFADIVLDKQGTAIRGLECEQVLLRAERHNPTTFAIMDAATDPHLGVSSLQAPISTVAAGQLRAVRYFEIYGAVVPNYFNLSRCEFGNVDCGWRFGSIIALGTNPVQPGSTLRTSTGYAPSKCGGQGINSTFQLAGAIATWGGGLQFEAGVLVEDTYLHGVEAQDGYVNFNADAVNTGLRVSKIAGFGLYAWMHSRVRVQNGAGVFTNATVDLNGHAGPITFDQATIASDWPTVIAGTPAVDQTQQTSVQYAFHWY